MKNVKRTKKQILVLAIKIVVTIFVLFVILTVVMLGVLGGIGPLGFVKENRLKNMAGNAEEYHLENVEVLKESPLLGKSICFLGSSVTDGDASLGVSFADYIAKRNQCSYVKEAIGGTTLIDNGQSSYIQRMINNIDVNTQFDAFVCQLSTNDATQKKPLGSISESTELQDFDTSTITGALEYIICYVEQTWDCPVIIYTNTKYDSEQYETMVGILYNLQEKWDIGIIDLWNNEEMNAVSEENRSLYMADRIHPTQAGYLLWWTPVIEEELYSIIQNTD